MVPILKTFGKDWMGKMYIMHSTCHTVNAKLMLAIIIINAWYLCEQKMK